MTAQGRACIPPPSCRWRDARVLITALIALLFVSCAGHRTVLDTFRFYQDAQLKIEQIIDRNSLAVADGLPSDLVDDLDALTPVSIAVRPDAILLSDMRSGRILRLDDDDIEVQAGSGSLAGLLGTRRAARFIRTDVAGNVYASDGVNDRITVLDGRLEMVSEINPPYRALELADGQLTGIATGAYGELYFADQVNAVVYRFDASGAFVSVVSGEGVQWAQMRRPMGLACDNHDGSLFVCDPVGRRVIVFDNSGAPVRAFGESDLREPEAVAIDDRGQVYVADPTAQAVVVFTREGHLIGRIDGERLQLDDFGTPSDVAIDNEFLLIVDPAHGRVLRIRLADDTEAAPAG